MNEFILASASPRRKQILKKAGYKFKIIPSHVNENHPKNLGAAALVQFLALKKAVAISKKYPEKVILGADTLVFIGRKAIGKPKNAKDAQRILGTLSGAWQRVYTGVAVVHQAQKIKWTQAGLSYVKFKKLTKKEIEDASTRHLDKAGAYSIQHKKDRFVERIRGDYDNVVGLPLKVVKKLLSRLARLGRSRRPA